MAKLACTKHPDMRYSHIIVYLLVLGSCTSGPKPALVDEEMAEMATEATSDTDTEAATGEEKSPEQLQREDEYNTSHPPALYELEGTLGGKTPITLSMSFFRGFCFGYLTYTDVGTPIQIVGTHGNYSNYVVYEFANGDDEATGKIELQASGRDGDLEVSGTWWLPDHSESYPLQLKRAAGDRMQPLRPHTPGDGMYSLELSSSGPSGVIELTRNVDQIMIDAHLLSHVHDSGTPNTGSITTALFQEGEAWVLQTEGDFDCQQRFYFVDQYAFIEHVSDDCGFGLGVTFNDFYLREPIDPAFLND